MKMTIRQKLISITLVIMLPLLIIAGYSYYMMIQATRHESSEQIRLIATDVSKDLNDIFDKSFSIIATLSTHPAVKRMDPSACDRLFATLLPSYPLHLNILAARMDGYNAGSAVPSPNVRQLNYLDKEWFQVASQGKRLVGNLHTSKLFKGPAIMIAAPVYGDDSTQKGVVGFPLNLESIREKIVKNWHLPRLSTVVVVDGVGNILVDTLHKERVGTNRVDKPVTSEARKIRNGFMEMRASDGIKRLYYVAVPESTDWRIIAGVPTAELNRNALLVNGRYLVVIIIATILGLALSILMGQRITKNINSIVKGIKAVGKGEFDYRMKLTGNDELSDIAGYFNTMAEQNHQYAQQIKNAATQWQTTFDAAHDLYLLLDKDYNIERVNQATSLFLGMPYQEILGKKCYNLIFGTDEPIPGSPFSRMLASGKHEEGEIWNEKKSVWQFFSVDPVFDEDGNLVQVIQIVRDITERKRAEEAFHEQFRQISAMFDGMNVIVHVVDPLTHELVYLNKYATSIFGSNWQGKPCHEVIGCGHPHPCALHDGNLSVDKDGVDSQNTYVYKNNITARWYQCLEKRMSWIDGRHVHITVATDITDLKNIMQMQEELISAVSHEMRTPLTAICGYTDFLLETPSAEVQTNDYLRIIQRESRRLEELLDNFLNMQRLKTRQASEIVQPLPPSPILTEAAALFTVSSPIHRIISNFPSDLPPVRIREVHMHELLNNLLSNAIKFSPKGGDIEIGARVEVDNSINFWVKDEGIGIPPDVREKVFEKFYQVESGDCRTFSGIGLGLALVKEIVNIYGGKVWVESTLGKGSTFYFSLPLA